MAISSIARSASRRRPRRTRCCRSRETVSMPRAPGHGSVDVARATLSSRSLPAGGARARRGRRERAPSRDVPRRRARRPTSRCSRASSPARCCTRTSRGWSGRRRRRRRRRAAAVGDAFVDVTKQAEAWRGGVFVETDKSDRLADGLVGPAEHGRDRGVGRVQGGEASSERARGDGRALRGQRRGAAGRGAGRARARRAAARGSAVDAELVQPAEPRPGPPRARAGGAAAPARARATTPRRGRARARAPVGSPRPPSRRASPRVGEVLQRAARGGRDEMIRALRCRGADAGAREGGDDAEAAAIDRRARRGRRGSAALLQAAYFGRTAVAKVLLEAGADPTLRDVDGKSPADWAASEGHAELAAILPRAANEGGTEARSGLHAAYSEMAPRNPFCVILLAHSTSYY